MMMEERSQSEETIKAEAGIKTTTSEEPLLGTMTIKGRE